MISDNVQLAWALVAGRLTNIGEFRDVPRGLRPTAVCEACGLNLVMKLGPIRAHHYAHLAHSNCPLTAPETARHYNTKQLLASKLRSTAALSVVTRCAFSSARKTCSTDLTHAAAEGWDTVRVETFIDPVRPDIVLLSDGTPILAIEVRATHAVSETKAASLSELGIRWVEVIAGDDVDQWMPGSPLSAVKHSNEAPDFCPEHSVRRETEVRERAETVTGQTTTQNDAVSLPSPRTNNGERWRFLVIDCYPFSGPRVRKVFWALCYRPSPTACRLRLVEDWPSTVIAEVRDTTDLEVSLRDLNDRLVDYLRKSYEQLDSSLSWLDVSSFPENPVMIYLRDFMSVRYERSADRQWSRVISDANS